MVDIAREDDVPPRSVPNAPTRSRIVENAAELICRQGVARTSTEQIAQASNVSLRCFHRHFSGKDPVVAAAVDHQIRVLMQHQAEVLGGVQDREGLRGWAMAVIEATRSREGTYGCPIGALVAQLADHSEDIRLRLDEAFRQWTSLLASALGRIQSPEGGRARADVVDTALGILATLQGGLILAQSAHDERRLHSALKIAIDRIDGAG